MESHDVQAFAKHTFFNAYPSSGCTIINAFANMGGDLPNERFERGEPNRKPPDRCCSEIGRLDPFVSLPWCRKAGPLAESCSGAKHFSASALVFQRGCNRACNAFAVCSNSNIALLYTICFIGHKEAVDAETPCIVLLVQGVLSPDE
eukprot:TRINITY_DN108129_c0_g1_i1.p3 TRINITY_DN108129_c0_g1~~TRINITY_DN108129_c0_g1_i1.p3  ORF type:complete len:147 (+),score=11.94 TRINITY_DN108129_c0_g1_i1:215-655(+)